MIGGVRQLNSSVGIGLPVAAKRGNSFDFRILEEPWWPDRKSGSLLAHRNCIVTSRIASQQFRLRGRIPQNRRNRYDMPNHKLNRRADKPNNYANPYSRHLRFCLTYAVKER